MAVCEGLLNQVLAKLNIDSTVADGHVGYVRGHSTDEDS